MRRLARVVLVAATLSACKVCGETIKMEVSSPSATEVASVIERDCGATTDFVTHVNLRHSDKRLAVDGKGTITQGEVFTFSGRAALELQWQSDTKFQIACDGCPEKYIFKRDQVWNGIELVYSLK
jgi:hypothetical protein